MNYSCSKLKSSYLSFKSEGILKSNYSIGSGVLHNLISEIYLDPIYPTSLFKISNSLSAKIASYSYI